MTRFDARLAETARRVGGKPAVVAGRVRYSYADLDLHASRLAAAFVRLKVGAGARVALFMEPTYAAIVSAAATLRAGATLVPIEARTNAESLARELARRDCVAMVTEARLAGVTAQAIADLRRLSVVVLSGADRSTVSGACLSFESAVSGLGPVAVPPTGSDADAAVEFVGEREPLTHRDLAAMGAAEGVREDQLVPATLSLASRAGLAAVAGAIAAGATLTVGRATVLHGRLRAGEAEAFRMALTG